MQKIIVMGLGSGSKRFLSKATIETLKKADTIFLRTNIHPVCSELNELGVKYESFDHMYESSKDFDQVYKTIVDKLIETASLGQEVVYMVPGHPCVGERTVSILKENYDNVEITSGISFLDSCFTALGIDPLSGLLVLDGTRLGDEQRYMLNPNVPTLVTQVYDRMIASDVKLVLFDLYPEDHLVTIISAAEVEGEEKIEVVPLYELDRIEWLDHLTTVYLPKISKTLKTSKYPADELVEIMEVLRSPEGCPWDRKQTMDSLKQYVIEETYEVISAIESGDPQKHVDELGDLLLQVVFQAQLAKENGDFDFNDVVDTISAKLIRRHPHVFAEANAHDAEAVLKSWEIIKREEKGESVETVSLFEGIETYLPALMKAVKVQSKAARVGFDWADASSALNKVWEEADELKSALASESEDSIKEELGDLIFSIVNVSRLRKIDPEEALRHTCDKFIKRFKYIEKKAFENGTKVEDMTLEEMDVFWEEAKETGI